MSPTTKMVATESVNTDIKLDFLTKCFNGDVEAVKSAIEAGADVTLKDSKRKLAHQQNRFRGKEPEKIELYLKTCYVNHILMQSLSEVNNVQNSIEKLADNHRKRL